MPDALQICCSDVGRLGKCSPRFISHNLSDISLLFICCLLCIVFIEFKLSVYLWCIYFIINMWTLFINTNSLLFIILYKINQIYVMEIEVITITLPSWNGSVWEHYMSIPPTQFSINFSSPYITDLPLLNTIFHPQLYPIPCRLLTYVFWCLRISCGLLGSAKKIVPPSHLKLYPTYSLYLIPRTTFYELNIHWCFSKNVYVTD